MPCSGTALKSPDVADDFEEPIDVKATFLAAMRHAIFARPEEAGRNEAYQALNRNHVSDDTIVEKTGLTAQGVASLRFAMREISETALAIALGGKSRHTIYDLQIALSRRRDAECGI